MTDICFKPTILLLTKTRKDESKLKSRFSHELNGHDIIHLKFLRNNRVNLLNKIINFKLVLKTNKLQTQRFNKSSKSQKYKSQADSPLPPSIFC